MVRHAPSHLELVALAREVQLAAAAADRERVRRLACQLSTGIAEHVEGDAERHRTLPPPVADLVARGQRRLLAHARALEEHAGSDDGRCLLPAAELTVLLGRQAVLERAVVHETGQAQTGAVPDTILHIADRRAWDAAGRTGRYEPPDLATEGFIHCSSAAQVVGVANRWYRHEAPLLLLAVDVDAVSDVLVHEESEPGETFPHLYGSLPVTAVRAVAEWPAGADGRFADLPPALDG